jgi:hypothetical protein
MKYYKKEYQRFADEKYDNVVIDHKLYNYTFLPKKDRRRNRFNKLKMKIYFRLGLFDIKLFFVRRKFKKLYK